MSARFSARPPLWLQTLLVAIVAVMASAAIFGRWSAAAWSQPHWLVGDPVEVYARVKIAAEQPGSVFLGPGSVAALGAPAVADWSAYSVPDRLVFAFTGLLAGPLGLIAAVQTMSLVLLGANAASFFICARWLRWRWEWAAALALVFALCTYNVRWGITLSFSQTFTLPPLLLLLARGSRRGPRPVRAWRWLAIGLGLWLAQGNPYLAYFSGVVGVGALVLASVRRAPWARGQLIVLFLAVLGAAFLVANARYLSTFLRPTAGAAMVRDLGDLRTYALRPADWFVPPADHRAPPLAKLGRDYFDQTQGRGEHYYNYLGVVGIAAFATLLAASVRRLWRRPRRPAEALLGFAWILAFGVAGGINTWLGSAGLDIFRASSRIGIYASVWLLLFLGGWLTRRLRPGLGSLTLALLIAGVAVLDQTPPLAGSDAPRINRGRWDDYAALTAALERSLPPRAMVFQLPVVSFPEAGPTGRMPDYEHLLPYLTSSSLRYSYGHLSNSDALRWARHTSRQPVSRLLEILELAGFSALWIDRRAYPDNAAALERELRAEGRVELPGPAALAEILVIALRPSANPQIPDFSDPRYTELWDESGAGEALFALEGWYPMEHSAANRWRWAGNHAVLGLWVETPRQDAIMRFRLSGPPSSAVRISLGKAVLALAAPGPETCVIRVPLAAGLNRIEWTLEGSTFRPGPHDPRDLGFMVENLTVSVP